MQLYADEDFPYPVVEELRRPGHDVLTAQEDGHQQAPARPHTVGRAVITHNRRHFERLHLRGAVHSGILTATHDPNHDVVLAVRIDAAIASLTPGRWCIRVNRPHAP